MTSDGFGEAQPVGGEAQSSMPSPADPFATPAPAPVGKPLPQPAAIYHPPPPPGTVPEPKSPPMPPPTFTANTGTERNWMAIVSLILGLFGGGLLGLGFGVAALQAVKAGRATNRTMAIWGIVLNCTMWIVYFVGFGAFTAFTAALAPATPADPGDSPPRHVASEDRALVTEIPLGRCFMDPELHDGYFYDVEVVSCDVPHDAQVYAVGQLDEQDYASEQHMADVARELCFTDEATSAIHPSLAPELYADAYYPGAQWWSEGDRGYVCFVWDENGPLSSSVLAADLETYVGD